MWIHQAMLLYLSADGATQHPAVSEQNQNKVEWPVENRVKSADGIPACYPVWSSSVISFIDRYFIDCFALAKSMIGTTRNEASSNLPSAMWRDLSPSTVEYTVWCRTENWLPTPRVFVDSLQVSGGCFIAFIIRALLRLSVHCLCFPIISYPALCFDRCLLK